MRQIILVLTAFLIPVFSAAQTIESSSGKLRQILNDSALKSTPPLDEIEKNEAATFFQGKTAGGQIPDPNMRQVALELAAIRTLSSAAQEIKPFKYSKYDELSLYLPGRFAVKMAKNLPTEGNPVTLACSTGVEALDKILAELPCSSIKLQEYGRDYDITFYFSQAVDMYTTKGRFLAAGLYTVSGSIGIGSARQSIYRFEKNGESQYAFGDAGAHADCMAGCAQKYIYFRVLWGPDGPKAYWVVPSRPWMSVYGYPQRYPARPFHDYVDLTASLSDPDWSVRYHAVKAIRLILHYGSTGTSEDGWLTDAAEKIRVKAILDAVAANKEALTQQMAAIGAQDPDPDVRKAASESNPASRN